MPGATVDFPRQEGPAMSANMRALVGALLIVGGMCAGVLCCGHPAVLLTDTVRSPDLQ